MENKCDIKFSKENKEKLLNAFNNNEIKINYKKLFFYATLTTGLYVNGFINQNAIKDSLGNFSDFIKTLYTIILKKHQQNINEGDFNAKQYPTIEFFQKEFPVKSLYDYIYNDIKENRPEIFKELNFDGDNTFLEKGKFQGDEEIKNEIKNETILNDEEDPNLKRIDFQYSEKLSRLNYVFNRFPVKKEMLLNKFNIGISKCALFDVENNTITLSEKGLNESIIKYKESLRNTINKYSSYKNVTNFNDKKARIEQDIVDGLKNSSSFLDNLYISNKEQYDAIEAFVMLENFDSLIDSNFSAIGYDIDINGLPRYKFKQGSAFKTRYNQNNYESASADEEIGELKKKCIELIQLKDGSYLQQSRFFELTNKLFHFSNYLSLDTLLMGTGYSMEKFHNYPSEVFEAVMRGLIKNPTFVSFNELNRNDIKTLVQIAKFLYGENPDDKSLYRIIKRVTYGNNSLLIFNPLDMISNIIDSITKVTYHGYRLNKNGLYESSIKSPTTKNKIIKMIRNRIDSVSASSNPNLVRKYNMSIEYKELNSYVNDTSEQRKSEDNYLTINYIDDIPKIDLFSRSNNIILEHTDDNNVKYIIKIGKVPGDLNIKDTIMLSVTKAGTTIIDASYSKRSESLSIGNSVNNDDLMEVVKVLSDFIGYDFYGSDKDLFDMYYNNNEIQETLTELSSIAYSGAMNQYLLYKYNENNSDSEFKSYYSSYTGIASDKVRYINQELNILKTLGNISPNLLLKQNNFIDKLGKSVEAINGGAVKLTVKNVENNDMGTSRVAGYYSTIAHWQYSQIMDYYSPYNNLIFGRSSLYPTVENIMLSTDVSAEGSSKMVKNMNANELMYKSIFLDFFGNYKNKKAVIQPIVYSDKTSFLSFVMDLNSKIKINNNEFPIDNLFKIYKNCDINSFYVDDGNVKKAFIKTIGNFYLQTFNNIYEDYFQMATFIKANNLDIYNNNKTIIDTLINSVDTEKESPYDEKSINERYKNKPIKILCKYADDFLSIFQSDKEFNDIAFKKKIDYSKDVSYVFSKNDNKLKLNPVLRYMSGYLYGNGNYDNFNNRWNNEKLNFLNSLLDIGFDIDLGSEYYDFENVNNQAMHVLSTVIGGKINYFFESKIVNKNNPSKKLILAKYKASNGEYVNVYTKADLPEDMTNIEISLNPILNCYFGISTLLNENMRLVMLGSEIAHPDKSGVDGFEGYNANGDLMYNDNIIQQETNLQVSQYKRALICVAPCQYFAQNKIYGCHKYKRVAAMKEPKEQVYNYLGDTFNHDVVDGGEFQLMLEHILENNTLQDAGVTDVTKPIGYGVNTHFGTTTEVKYASVAMTNERIRSSVGNGQTDLYMMMKKMCDFKFDENIKFETWFNVRNSKSLFKNIVSNELYFTKEGKRYKIEDIEKFGTEPFVFKRRLYEVDEYGNLITFFDGKNNRVTIKEDIVKMDSLFNMWEALGGMWSMQKEGGRLVIKGDDSLYATVDYMNKIGNVRVDKNGNKMYDGNQLATQGNINQPLKDPIYYISSLNPNSTLKNGSINENDANAWTDKNVPLRSFTMETAGFGVQGNMDHVADDAEITEPSQVMNALCAGGNTIDIAHSAYRSLEGVINVLLGDEFEKNLSFISSETNKDISIEQKKKIREEFVSVISRDILNTKSSQITGMIGVLLDKLCRKYNISDIRKNNIKTSIDKVPFSDTEIYNSALPNFISKINTSVIKKKFPGVAAVMCPSSNIHMVYRIDGIPMNVTDIYKKICNENIGIDFTGKTNNQVVREYLELKQQEEYKKPFSPNDVLLGTKIIANVKVNNSEYNVFVDLDKDINIYWKFKESEEKRIEVLKEEIKRQYPYVVLNDKDMVSCDKVYKDVIHPTNLQPQRINWIENGHSYDIFDIDEIKLRFKFEKKNFSINDLNENQRNIFYEINRQLGLDVNDVYSRKKDKISLMKNIIQSKFDGIANGISPISGEHVIIKNSPAENIISKIYASKLGLKSYSLYDVFAEKEKFFSKQISTYDIDDTHSLYDIKLCINQNKNIKIVSLNNISEYNKLNSDNKVHIHENNTPTMLIEKDGVQYIYEIDKNGNPIIKLGKIVVDENGDEKNEWFLKPYTINYNDLTKEKIYVYEGNNELDSIADIVNNNFISLIKTSEAGNGVIKSMIDNNINITDVDTKNYFNDYINNGNSRNNRIDVLSKKKYISFLKSLDTICLRIPSQAMQSFMNMKTVGFMEGEGNNIYVSKWQTYLQGSDYDIDKAYCIGYEFGDNGMYIKNSPLYDDSSYEASIASDALPTPKGIEYSFNQNQKGYNISRFFSEWVNASDNIGKIRALANMFNMIDIEAEQETNLLCNVEQENEALFNEFKNAINLHSTYKIPDSMMEGAFKNSVASCAHRVIRDPRNAIQAYSPITFGNLHQIADESSMGKSSKINTTMNPATKMLVQFEAQEGKTCIGIFATGTKVYFALTYYYDMALRSNNKEWIKNLYFSKQYNINKLKEDNVKCLLSNVNLSYLNENEIHEVENIISDIYDGFTGNEILNTSNDLIRSEIERKLKSISNLQQDTSLQISAMLSAATVNAQEFILSKINSGKNLSGMYMHLMMLGYDLESIAKYMTLPHVQLINKYSQQNLFDKSKGNNSVKTALNLFNNFNISDYFHSIAAKTNYDFDDMDMMDDEDDFGGDFSAPSTDISYVIKYMCNSFIKNIKSFCKSNNINMDDFFSKTKRIKGSSNLTYSLGDVHNGFLKLAIIHPTELFDILDKLRDISGSLSYSGKSSIVPFISFWKQFVIDIRKELKIRNETDLKNNDVDSGELYTIENINSFFNDIKEFSSIYDDSKEIQTLGQILGINQGIKTKGSERLKKITQFQDFFNNRVSKFIKNKYNNSKKDIESFIDAIKSNNKSISKLYSDEELSDIISTANSFNMLSYPSFSMKRFITEESYRDAACKMYNLIKCQYNIFDIINKNPNVRGMYKAFNLILSIQENMIGKDYMIDGMTSLIRNENNVMYLTEDESSKLVSFSDDVIKYNFITSRTDFIFNPSKRMVSYREEDNIDEIGKPMAISIIDQHSIATFNKFFYQEFVPRLKNGFIGNDSTYYYALKNNEFIKALTTGFDEQNNEVSIFWQLNIDMNDVKNPKLFAKRAKIAADIMKLKSFTYNGKTLLDWFVLYNFVVNKNRYGENKLTTAFQPLINDNDDNLLKDYYNYIIDFDNSSANLSKEKRISNSSIKKDANLKEVKTLNDIRYNPIDLNVAIATKGKVAFSTRPYIYAWSNARQSMVLKKKNGSSYSESYDDMSISHPTRRQRTIFKSWYPYRLKNSINFNELFEKNRTSVISNLVEQGKIKMYLNCQ